MMRLGRFGEVGMAKKKLSKLERDILSLKDPRVVALDQIWDRFLDLDFEVEQLRYGKTKRSRARCRVIRTEMLALLKETEAIFAAKSKTPLSYRRWRQRSNMGQVYLWLGYCHYACGSYADADACFAKSFQYDTTNSTYYEGYAWYLMNRGRMVEAAKLFRDTPAGVIRSEEETMVRRYLEWILRSEKILAHMPPVTLKKLMTLYQRGLRVRHKKKDLPPIRIVVESKK
jgi:tetratricopeptide (TPR) repeat protein